MEIIITGTTCGESCWAAQEDICRCSCGGRNHGVLRTSDGSRPERTSKINGIMYRLIAVGTMHEIGLALRKRQDEIRDAGVEKTRWGSPDYYCNDRGSRFQERKASLSAIAAWPELTAARSVPAGTRWYDIPCQTLWERVM